MKSIRQRKPRLRQRRPRLRLDAGAYRNLCSDVLERDGWRCQKCGTSECLQMHHIRSRSALGDDAAENLITLCADCHRQSHLSY
jgi:5-methylcytosine-specific restriction endonuclease McrA